VPDRPITIFLSAAEASGDAHAANLLRAIRALAPGARFVGVAGPRMAAEGCAVLADLTKKAAMLLGGPILRLGYYWRTVRRLQKAIRDLRPDLCIPVDSPAFNWHMAAAAKKAGSPVLYYVAPQVWAWAPWRVKKLARVTDRVACILPFEEAYLRERGVRAEFVGHPIFDEPQAATATNGATETGAARTGAAGTGAAGTGAAGTVPGAVGRGLSPVSEPTQVRTAGTVPPHTAQGDSPRGAVLSAIRVLPDLTEAWAQGTWQVALLPGSRPAEVAHHTEGLLTAADAILRRWPRARCTFAIHHAEAAERIRRACQYRHPGRLDVVAGPAAALDVLARSHFALAGSGTITVQAAALGVPMVVFYRTGLFSRLLYHTLGRSRRLMPTRHLCLVNILAGERIVPELMPWNGNLQALVARTMEVMGDLGCLHEMRRDLLKAVAPLAAPPGTTAAGNAAKMAMALLGK
jgi:lipid A disaccharide synthetase